MQAIKKGASHVLHDRLQMTVSFGIDPRLGWRVVRPARAAEQETVSAAIPARLAYTEAAAVADQFPALAGIALAPLRLARDADELTLWAEEAAHRARNLAQLAISQGRRAWSAEVRADASSLAQAYGDLDRLCPSALGPCHALLTRIAASLVAVFGQQHGRVDLLTRVASLDLPPGPCRALVLIASELVLNALKHACPNGAGVIRVTLERHGEKAVLAVEDDGPGVAGRTLAGEGSRLLGALAGILGGRMERAAGLDGGLRTTVTFPVRDESVGTIPGVTS